VEYGRYLAAGTPKKYDHKTQYPPSNCFGSETDLGVVHLVGGKLDLAMANPALRAVPFEQACAYAEENLDDMQGEYAVGDDLSCHEVSAKDDTGTPNLSPRMSPWVLQFLAL
jgi:hypothetical protein